MPIISNISCSLETGIGSPGTPNRVRKKKCLNEEYHGISVSKKLFLYQYIGEDHPLKKLHGLT